MPKQQTFKLTKQTVDVSPIILNDFNERNLSIPFAEQKRSVLKNLKQKIISSLKLAQKTQQTIVHIPFSNLAPKFGDMTSQKESLLLVISALHEFIKNFQTKPLTIFLDIPQNSTAFIELAKLAFQWFKEPKLISQLEKTIGLTLPTHLERKMTTQLQLCGNLF